MITYENTQPWSKRQLSVETLPGLFSSVSEMVSIRRPPIREITALTLGLSLQSLRVFRAFRHFQEIFCIALKSVLMVRNK